MEEKRTDFAEFLNKQNEIYDRIRNTNLTETGICPREDLYGKGSYLIVFRHPAEITDALEMFSERISKVVKGITYNAANAHTTISDYDLRKDFKADDKTLEILIESADIFDEIKSGETFAKIHYDKWLVGKDSIIAGGTPDEHFLDNSLRVIRKVKEKSNIDLRMPWGAHITSFRFNQKIDGNSELIDELKKIVSDSPPLGMSLVKEIDVCIQRIDKNENKLFPVARYTL